MKSFSFIDFSNKLSNDTLSFIHLNNNSKNFQSIANQLGFLSSMMAIPDQIHSSDVLYIDKPGNYNNIDGLITNIPNIFLTLKVADCVPVYIYASKTKIIGLIHAGWRGIIGGIVQNAILNMNQLGAEKTEINLFLGPSIGICCYEVDEDVAVHFNINAKVKLKNGKWKVGLREQIIYTLVELGIINENIKQSNICTFEEKDFHSYRRDGINSDRMIAFLGIKE